MPPKKSDSKSKGNLRTGFSEVERAFYELQLTDCNRKVARLRQSVNNYEVRNEELQKAYDTLDEDRADIIAFLKKTLTVKSEENAELKERVRSLEELREEETAKFRETVSELERNFTRMKDQLTSENKLMAGKLNTLEEFRAIRDDLMKKFDKQERAFEEQEMKYKRIIYDTEKKFIIGKDKLKKEMEERLLELAQQFQDASELRIAASTHRVIRENIALNNQLDSLLLIQAKVAEQNEKFREDERAARCAKEVAEEERDKAMNKSIVQLKVIDQLTLAFEDVKKQKAIYEKKQFDSEKLIAKIQKLTKTNNQLMLQVRVLEQNMHAALGDQNKSLVETAKQLRERETFKRILKESAIAVHASLKMNQWDNIDRDRELIEREVILNKILDVINQYRDAVRAESTESLVSLGRTYDKGDLGVEVKSVPSKKTIPFVGGLDTTKSFLSFEDKRSGLSVSDQSSSEKSLKTIPSITVLPINEEESLPTPKDSLPSFTVMSSHSSIISSSLVEESESVATSISKMLDMSRLEVQKSLMADLAVSMISQQRLNVIGSKSRIDTPSQKSLTTIPIEDKPVTTGEAEDGAAHSQVHFSESTGKPTQISDEPTKELVGEPVAGEQQGDEEDKKDEASAK